MKDQATEAAIAAGAQKVSFGAGTVALYGGMTANEIAAFGGLLIAFVGLCVQVHFKRRHDKREAAWHAERMTRAEPDEHENAGV